MAVVVRFGMVWHGRVGLGPARQSSRGVARRGLVGHGWVRQGSYGKVRHDRAWLVLAGHGRAGSCEAVRVRHVAVRHGRVRRGGARPSRPGMARSGLVRCGEARWGAARQGRVGQCKAWFPLRGELKMAQKYKARKGSRLNNKQAQAVGQELEKIGDHVTPEQLVEAARPKSSPIHSMFEWNAKAAAESYRVGQARQYIGAVEVEVIIDDISHSVRGWHSVEIEVEEHERATQYVATNVIMQESGLRNQVLAKARAQLTAWKNRYRDYADVFGRVFQAIEEEEEAA